MGINGTNFSHLLEIGFGHLAKSNDARR